MATPDLMQSVQTIRAALPLLEELATLAAQKGELTKAVGTLQATVNDLEAQCRVQMAQLRDESQAGDVARAQRVKDAAVAEGLLNERLADLQRSQQAAEQALALTRSQIQQAGEQQAEDHAKWDTIARQRLAVIVQKEQAAAARLAGIQEKLTALHGGLASLATP